MLPECGALGVTAETIEAAIVEGPKPAAVLLTRPTYYGLARTLEPIAAVCRRHGIPLLVDEAHGPHLKFLPPGGPTPALDAGADLVAQSCHKTLGSLVGTAQVHVGRNSPVSPEQVRDALNFLQTTSPNYLQLVVARRQPPLAWPSEGAALFAEAVAEAAALADADQRACRGSRC